MSAEIRYDRPVAPADPDAEYLTVQEAAHVLRCGVRYLRDGINEGRFSAARWGRRIVMNRADRAAAYELMRIPAEPRTRRIVRQRRPAA